TVMMEIWDERENRIKEWNFAIFAPTGEGKAFSANDILRRYFETGVRLVIIDLGGSYTKFAKLYPKDHIILRYESGKNLGINPFYISSVEDLTAERLEDLAVFLFELILIFLFAYTMWVFGGDEESAEIKQTLIPELEQEQSDFKSKYDAVNALKEVRETTPPSIYDE